MVSSTSPCARGMRALFVLFAMALIAAPARAGSFTDLASPTIYRLSADAAFSEGCFDPCDCLLAQGTNFRGTFGLRITSLSGTFIEYAVSDVNWYVNTPDGERHITGAGTYTRISGFAGWAHRMQLDLRSDDGTPVSFDSGLLNGGGDFPHIAINISMNNLVCFDTLIEIDADPVPSNEVIPYRLARRSHYQEGCLPPCLCPILADLPLRGAFSLVPLFESGTFSEFAVVGMDMRVIAPFDPPSSAFSGNGRYTVISGIAGYIERMELSLSIDGADPVAFDSGIVPLASPSAFIDIEVAQNGFFCYDIVLDIKARRLPTLSASVSTLADAP